MTLLIVIWILAFFTAWGIGAYKGRAALGFVMGLFALFGVGVMLLVPPSKSRRQLGR